MEESVHEESKFGIDQDLVPHQLRMQVKKLTARENQKFQSKSR